MFNILCQQCFENYVSRKILDRISKCFLGKLSNKGYKYSIPRKHNIIDLLKAIKQTRERTDGC